MNYIGRKYSLLEFLESGILGRVGKARGTLFDVFAGTGVVGWHFKGLGFRVVANDFQHYAYCLNRAFVGTNTTPHFSGLRDTVGRAAGDPSEDVLGYLNNLSGRDGFVFRNYCSGGRGAAGRLYFSDENGRRCDAIRTRIGSWRRAGRISEREYYYLLASLIVGMDRVANTASVYAAYLKRVKKSAQRSLRLEPIGLVQNGLRHQVHQRDALHLVGRVPCDVLYMDPPYNHRQYHSNYHVLETIARYDRPQLHGITGLRPDPDLRSDFCLRRRALPALEQMVSRTRARHVFLSYNSEGLMPQDGILATMGRYGKVEVCTRDYARFRADADSAKRKYKANKVIEYLFCLEKR
jgi:adenine-specific DNA-methyltransferase